MPPAPPKLDSEMKEMIAEIMEAYDPVDYSDQFLDILQVCPKHLDHQDIIEFISWFVNHQLYLILDIINAYEISLINRIFDPSSTQIEKDRVSKGAFEAIAGMIEKDSDRHEFYIMAVILDLSQEDFDSLCLQGSLFGDESGSRFQKYLVLFKEHFQVQRIPRLLKFLSTSSANKSKFSAAFNVLWEVSDEANAVLVADFVWNCWFDANLLNTCDALTVTNRKQEIIFWHILSHYMKLVGEFGEKVEDKDQVKRICKIFFLKPYIKDMQAFYEKSMLLIVDQVLIATEDLVFFTRLAKVTQEVFFRSCEEFSQEIVQKILNAANSIPNITSNNIETFIETFIKLDYPEYNWLIFQGLKVMGSEKYQDRRWVKCLIRELIFSQDWKFRSHSERREFLLFLISYDSVDDFMGFASFMARSYPVELRPFENEIKLFLLRPFQNRKEFMTPEEFSIFKDSFRIFGVVSSVLTSRSLMEFHAIYLFPGSHTWLKTALNIRSLAKTLTSYSKLEQFCEDNLKKRSQKFTQSII
jgi:hypothetical protein